MPIAIYLRQSRDRDGNELAITRQREDCLKLCADRGWPDTVEYVDNDVSASSRRKSRPAYKQMITDIANGTITGIVVWDLDRLYRQPRELEDLIDLADDHKLSLATVTGDVDLSTDNGRLYARIKGAVARAEGERKAARWKRSNEQGAANGKWVTVWRPFGYTMAGELLEPEATLLRQAFHDVLDGKSLRRIAADWNAAGVPSIQGAAWTNSSIRRMLLSPRYAALRVLRGRIVGPGAWEPLIDHDTWQGVGALLRDESRRVCTTFEVTYQGVGVYHCGRCGSVMRTFYYSHTGKRAYICKATPHLVRQAQEIDDMVTAQILGRLAAENITLDDHRGDVTALRARRETLAHRKDELSTLFTEGVLDGAAVRRDSAKLAAQIADMDRQLADAARINPVAGLIAGGISMWDSMTAAQRGQVIDRLVTVTIQPCPPGQRRFNPDYVDIEWKNG